MLKFEKQNSRSALSVVMREKHPVFTSSLLIGLVLALVVHITPFFLIRIRSGSNWSVLPPFSILIERGDENLLKNSADYESETMKEKNHPWIPPEKNMEYPILSLNSKFFLEEFVSGFSSGEDVLDLQEIENEAYREMAAEVSFPVHFPEYEIKIFGDLSEIPVHIPKSKTLALPHNTLNRSRLAFHILVDNEKGSVIWHELIAASGDQKKNQRAEKILKTLQFDAAHRGLFTAGDVEIVFTGAKDKKND